MFLSEKSRRLREKVRFSSLSSAEYPFRYDVTATYVDMCNFYLLLTHGINFRPVMPFITLNERILISVILDKANVFWKCCHSQKLLFDTAHVDNVILWYFLFSCLSITVVNFVLCIYCFDISPLMKAKIETESYLFFFSS